MSDLDPIPQPSPEGDPVAKETPLLAPTPEPLSPVDWPLPVLVGVMLLSVAFTYVSTSALSRSGFLDTLGSDIRIAVVTIVLAAQYLPSLALAYAWGRHKGVGLAAVFSARRFNIQGALLAVAAAFVVRAVGMQYVQVLMTLGVEPPPTPDLTALFPMTVTGVIATVLLAVVIAPIAEEAFFRGVVFGGLQRRWGRTAGAVVSAALFAAIHLSWFQFLPLFVLGLALAQLLAHTRSIWPAVICHAAFNATAVGLLYLLRAFGVGA